MNNTRTWTVKGTKKAASEFMAKEYIGLAYRAIYKRLSGKGSSSMWEVKVTVIGYDHEIELEEFYG